MLRKIDRLMNWQSFLPLLKRGLKRTGIGPQGYDPLVLFKCLLIGQWHGLSDPNLERAEGDEPDDPELHFSADPDARWVKKGSKSTLDYRALPAPTKRALSPGFTQHQPTRDLPTRAKAPRLRP